MEDKPLFLDPQSKDTNSDSRFELYNECESAKKALKREFGLKQILGISKAVQELHEKIDRISSCDVNVLITGECGTGKELAARGIHYLSGRAGRPFIPVNCGAIPENLFENELFGHVKGAFTDARFKQVGLVEEAGGGTLFLDEISAASLYVQVKLLRLLQDKEYKVLGDSRPHKADIRIIAATNRDLASLVKEGIYREDLYYRLNIVSIHIPPLRERKEDIPILVEYFIKKYSREYNKPIKEVSVDAMEAFISYQWPGNIRELENKIQQLVVMFTSTVVTVEDLQLPITESAAEESGFECFKMAKKKIINDFEKTYFIRLLTEYKGDVVSSARKAGKSRTAFWNILKKHNLSPKQFRY
ncbi:MAG: sigma-54 dependent transcriptional regulator [Candidatus Brocadiales bacterium]|nr:sigma-54 dependent transcriptional regulator [Candidatus Brocadiales bacterium]